MKSCLIPLLGLLVVCYGQEIEATTNTTVAPTTTTNKQTVTTTSTVTTTTMPKVPTTTTGQKTSTHKTDTTHPETTSPTSVKPSTTEASPTTTKMVPSTTTPHTSGIRHITVREDGITCLKMDAIIYAAFSYTSAKTKKSKNLNSTVPSDVETYGTCGNSSDKLALQWTDNNITLTLSMWFNKSSDDYSLATVHFICEDATGEPSTTTMFEADVDKTVKTALGSAYKCSSGVTINVDKLTLTMTNLTVGAFMNTNSTDPGFANTGTDCSYSGKTDAIVPIAVGAALAAMVLIVLVGYCIGRRRSAAAANNYQPMDSS